MPKKYFFPPPKIRINKLVFILQRTLFAGVKALCHKKPADYRKKHSFLQFWHTAFAQDMSISSSVPQKTGITIQEFGTSRILVLLCLCREKRSFFDKPRLQRLPKRSSVHQVCKVGIREKCRKW